MKHRGQIVSSMQKKDHTQLWNGIMNDKFDQFWSVNGRLMETSTEEGFKYIPFRCYISEDKYIQRLVKPINEEGQRKTLKHLLNEVFPDQKNGTVTQVSLTSFSNKGYITTVCLKKNVSLNFCFISYFKKNQINSEQLQYISCKYYVHAFICLIKLILTRFYFTVTVRTHGIIPPSETPLQWMSEHLSYPDNFLHLIVVTL